MGAQIRWVERERRAERTDRVVVATEIARRHAKSLVEQTGARSKLDASGEHRAGAVELADVSQQVRQASPRANHPRVPRDHVGQSLVCPGHVLTCQLSTPI